MIDSMSYVKTGEVTYAVRDTVIDDKEIKEGKCEEAIRANMALSDAEIREKYNNREIEK